MNDTDNTIYIYTDGGCAPNPGDGGVGILMLYKDRRLEKWEYIKNTTNNVCELTAILHALQRVKNKKLPTIIYSDSTYAISVSTGIKRALKNKELVDLIKQEITKFNELKFVKVPAHSGIEHNEFVDGLCEKARKEQSGGELYYRPN